MTDVLTPEAFVAELAAQNQATLETLAGKSAAGAPPTALGVAALLKLALKNELEASVEEISDLNRDSIEGLADLTGMAQSLKDFSRLDRAPVDSFDVNAGLDKTLLIAKNIVKHKATVTKHYGEIPEIECSPSQINQVFLNIITNAAQAIEKTGEIVITTKLYDPDRVAIRIADTGCGIAPELLQNIFEPCFTKSRTGKGTGLGLFISHQIIDQHGGTIEATSPGPGQGSTFTVRVPLREVATGDGMETPEPPVLQFPASRLAA